MPQREDRSTATTTTTTTTAPRRSATGEAGAEGRPGGLVMDVAGAYLRPLGGWMPVASMVVLLGQLGVDEQAVRSAVHRIAKRGLLVPERRSGVRGYGLSDAAGPLLEEADRRIFSTAGRARTDDGWVLVSFSVPEHERDRRHTLRSRLTWLGFGNLANGLWIAPARVADELTASVRRLGFERYVTVFLGSHAGFEPTGELVRRCWDLDGLRTMYAGFLQQWEPVRERWAARRPEPRAAFVDYTLLLNQWRKFPYLDPGLPLALLPAGWEGQRAAEVFSALRSALEGAAVRHARETAARQAPAHRAPA
jgi:phenylacetic acid degradation operon negative regulatory protein